MKPILLMLLCAASWCTGNAATGYADASSTSASKEMEQGITLVRRAEWDKALIILERIRQTPPSQQNRTQRSTVSLYLGLCYVHLLQQQRGIDAFKQALSLDPCIQLPAALDLSPQIRALFQKTSQDYQPACLRQKATVPRESNPPPRPPVRRRQEDKPLPRQPDGPKPSANIRLSGWLVLGTGVLTLGTAFVFGGLALWDEVQRNERPLTPLGTEQYLELDQRARDRATVANIMFGASGILLFTGFALHISQWIQPLLPPPVPQKPTASRVLFSE